MIVLNYLVGKTRRRRIVRRRASEPVFYRNKKNSRKCASGEAGTLDERKGEEKNEALSRGNEKNAATAQAAARSVLIGDD